MHQIAAPILVVVSGPSGAGKGTAVEALVQLGFARRPTFTTRPPRPVEVDGVHYNFVNQERFDDLRQSGRLIEYTRTYSDFWYGAPAELCDSDDRQPWVVELEVNGFHRVRAASNRRVIGVFVAAEDWRTATERIEARSPESNLERRIEVMPAQQAHAWSFDYVLLNTDLANFAQNVQAIGRAEIARTEGAEWLLRSWPLLDPTVYGPGQA